MSLPAAIYDILGSATGVTALVGGSRSPRIYPQLLPAGKDVPALVTAVPGDTLEDTCDEQIEPRTGTVEVTCLDDDPDGALALAEAVRAALRAGSGSHGGVTVHYAVLLDEREIRETNEGTERLTRCVRRQTWEIAYST